MKTTGDQDLVWKQKEQGKSKIIEPALKQSSLQQVQKLWQLLQDQLSRKMS
jgi:hypothetical protein